MAPLEGAPVRSQLGSMARNTKTWPIRSDCLSNITSLVQKKKIKTDYKTKVNTGLGNHVQVGKKTQAHTGQVDGKALPV